MSVRKEREMNSASLVLCENTHTHTHTRTHTYTHDIQTYDDEAHDKGWCKPVFVVIREKKKSAGLRVVGY